jgi:hypothetical protein
LVRARNYYALTLEGRYIIKNLVLVSGALVIGATVRDGQLLANTSALPDPGAAQSAHAADKPDGCQAPLGRHPGGAAHGRRFVRALA